MRSSLFVTLTLFSITAFIVTGQNKETKPFPDFETGKKPLQPKVVFTVMGCGPYNSNARIALKNYIQLENKDNKSSFLIHLGDICKGTDAILMKHLADKGEKTYSTIRKNLTENNRIPTFILPGDNETTDRMDPETGLKLWNKNLLSLEKNFDVSWKVKRQESRQENFSFIINGVLFIGIHKVGGKAVDNKYWNETLKDSKEWIAENLKIHNNISSAVILAHAAPKNKDDWKSIKDAAGSFKKPVLYINADNHKWNYQPAIGPKNLTHLTLDLIHSRSPIGKQPYFPPVRIYVSDNPTKPFIFNRHLSEKKWIEAGIINKAP